MQGLLQFEHNTDHICDKKTNYIINILHYLNLLQ